MNTDRRARLASWACAVGVAVAAVLTPTAAAVAAPPAFVACPAGEYQNVDNACVPRPQQSDTQPDGATAQCKDGTYSFSQHRSGTCSGHGGVSRWL
ncbi:DUF3761 domain-containing protein [Nocardia sp. NPDC003482]|uniref:DUF3761 domain-containing protein n=1 Tax=Nocardia sp. NPDC004068 TaxID=3364303 RepID=UPI0036856EFF